MVFKQGGHMRETSKGVPGVSPSSGKVAISTLTDTCDPAHPR
jgi:hypothetical protein